MSQSRSRVLIAFLVAPLIVPFVLAFFILVADSNLKFAAVTFAIAAIVTYAGVLLIGIPAYYVLRAINFMSVWAAMGLGVFAGVTMGMVFDVWLAMNLGTEFTVALADWDWGQFWLIAIWCGPLGATVGLVMWLIAPPARVPVR